MDTASSVLQRFLTNHVGPHDKEVTQAVFMMQVLLIDQELNAIVVKGAIPGKPGNLVEILPAKIVGTNC